MSPTKKPKATLKRTYMALRLSDEERKLVHAAAGEYPVATWARVELVRLAREKLGMRKGR